MAQTKLVSPTNKILGSLFLTGFATHARLIISSLLLIEIGTSFNIPVGIAGQIVTAASILTVISALFMGVLTIRYNSKPLLLTGIIIYFISGLGCFLSPNFITLLISYSLAGIGGAMVFPMLGTIIGETLPPEGRSKAMGLITAGQPISFTIGSPIVARIAASQGWRMSFLWYMVPVVVISFMISYFGLPKQSLRKQETSGDGNLVGFRGVFKNRSAISCLLGALLFQASMFTAWTYVISFFREDYLISQSMATSLVSLMTMCSALGSLTVGRLVNRWGKRHVTVVLVFLFGLFGFVVFSPFNMWVSFGFCLVWSYLAASSYVSGDTLTLDQVPEFRGTLMSLNILARNLGSTLGGILGGALLIVLNYNVFGYVMGFISLIAAVVYMQTSD